MTKKENLVTQHGEQTELTISEEPTLVQPPTSEEIAQRRANLKDIEKIDHKNKPKVVSRYWEAGQGDNLKGVFTGLRMLTKKDDAAEDGLKRMPAVVFDTLNGELMSAAMQLVDTFSNNVPVNSAVYVECIKAKSGQMKEFDVRILKDAK